MSDNGNDSFDCHPLSMTRSTKNAETFPKEIGHEKNGVSASAKIYRAINGEHVDYTLVYYNQNGERKRLLSRNLAALETRAVEILDDLISGGKEDHNALTAYEREEYASLKRIAAEVGISPLIALRHFVESVKILG